MSGNLRVVAAVRGSHFFHLPSGFRSSNDEENQGTSLVAVVQRSRICSVGSKYDLVVYFINPSIIQDVADVLLNQHLKAAILDCITDLSLTAHRIGAW